LDPQTRDRDRTGIGVDAVDTDVVQYLIIRVEGADDRRTSRSVVTAVRVLASSGRSSGAK
jgi:hypothetical protein